QPPSIENLILNLRLPVEYANQSFLSLLTPLFLTLLSPPSSLPSNYPLITLYIPPAPLKT
ncbi:MAG: hypothetical protein IIU52_04910, partial [Bacteroidaceae bacterium]|nr:hypothetical protein [Bacteroidaceae bacterium]